MWETLSRPERSVNIVMQREAMDFYSFNQQANDGGMTDTYEEDSQLELAHLAQRLTPTQLEGARSLLNNTKSYQELLMTYSCAIMRLRTKFEVLNTEYNVRYQRNPIHFIDSRLKSTSSIVQKLDKLGIPFSVEGIRENLHDVAGIRVVCGYLDDVYVLAETFLRQEDITLVQKKDYIASPKPNGYRSLHLVIKVPVFFAEQTHNLAAEVQIRTIAQHYWAGLEHQLKYKRHQQRSQAVVDQLQECAEVLDNTEWLMLAIRRDIENGNTPDASSDFLRQRLQQFGL